MSSEAYAKLVAHNNTIVQQFKSYKEAQERALTEAYGRLAALKEFCEKERQEKRDEFEREKQAMCDGFEREKQTMRDGFEREKQTIRDGFEREKRAIRDGFEKEKQTMRDGFEREKQTTRDGFEREKQTMRDSERHSTLALEKEKQSGGTVDTNQLMNKALADFFNDV